MASRPLPTSEAEVRLPLYHCLVPGGVSSKKNDRIKARRHKLYSQGFMLGMERVRQGEAEAEANELSLPLGFTDYGPRWKRAKHRAEALAVFRSGEKDGWRAATKAKGNDTDCRGCGKAGADCDKCRAITNWYISCGCENHGDHGACVKECGKRGYGCHQPVGLSFGGTLEESEKYGDTTPARYLVERAIAEERERLEKKHRKLDRIELTLDEYPVA